MNLFRKMLLIFISALLLSACVNPKTELHRGEVSFRQQNYRNAYLRLAPLAKQGNADAQYAVGYMYFYGQGVVEDRGRGFTWMKRAAEQGQPQALAAVKMLQQTRA